jgi:hypothetical protein
MPQITEISVSASRKFNHPFEDYSNLESHVTLHASLTDNEDVDD